MGGIETETATLEQFGFLYRVKGKICMCEIGKPTRTGEHLQLGQNNGSFGYPLFQVQDVGVDKVPRSLYHRSYLLSAFNPRVKEIMNHKIAPLEVA